MPLYELFVISRTFSGMNNNASLVKLMQKIGLSLLKEGNVILRDIEFMGHQILPYRIKCKIDNQYAYEGSYWLMKFYANSQINNFVKEKLKHDTDILRFTLLKHGDTLKRLIR